MSVEVTSVEIASQKFTPGERVAWVTANNTLTYGVIVYDGSLDPARVVIRNDKGFHASPTRDRVAHLLS